LYKLSNLTYIENFPSVVELKVFDCPKLKRISNLSKLQKIEILYCSNILLGRKPTPATVLLLGDDGVLLRPEFVLLLLRPLQAPYPCLLAFLHAKENVTEQITTQHLQIDLQMLIAVRLPGDEGRHHGDTSELWLGVSPRYLKLT
jgi:hypothetical protein